ncbi:MAG TPA: hypothetical protein VFQ38_09500 [Longimicrobiales bacterium]|nr:hypothetical protein [Longimicrobiales bacterium]
MRRRLLRAVALLGTTGCGVLGHDGKAQVTFGLQGDLPSAAYGTTIHVQAPGWRRTITKADFARPDAPNHTPAFDTPAAGPLRVDFVVEDSARRPVSSGAVELALRSDWIWGIEFWVASENPTRTCFGCAGYRAFPIAEAYRRTPADSLYVVWGGNSIENPVVF